MTGRAVAAGRRCPTRSAGLADTTPAMLGPVPPTPKRLPERSGGAG
jgi:hypothetical protein